MGRDRSNWTAVSKGLFEEPLYPGESSGEAQDYNKITMDVLFEVLTPG